MIITKIKNKINKYRIISYHKFYPTLCTVLDKRTNRHIVVIESDDWGTIRVPSKEVKDYIISLGVNMNAHPFERHDTLETDKDMEELYNVLLSYKDNKGHHPIITANTLMANPDFRRIKESGYTHYFHEPISQTYASYPNSHHVQELIRKGIDLKCFYPQSHGREHFRIQPWLDALQRDDEKEVKAFEKGMCVLFPKDREAGNELLKALYYNNADEKRFAFESVVEGLDMFERIFRYKSVTYVAPCYAWPSSIEKMLCEKGVGLIQTDRACTDIDEGSVKYHYNGEKRAGMIYSIRNCCFEPSVSGKEDEWKSCLAQVRKAFQSRKVAVISSHRLNYAGGIESRNRDNTLKQLNLLLRNIIKEWPDVEFLSSEDLYRLYI